MDNTNFWDNRDKSESVISELNALKRMINEVSSLKDKIDNNLEIITSLSTEEVPDSEFLSLVEEEIKPIENELSHLETEMLLNGPYDKLGAIMEIHSGAGGTEACDWADMLYRMYTRWCEKKNYKIEVIDSQPGDEVGIKSLTMLIKGMNAFGYLKGEKGVHRLVRISPFDSNARRHTSFASVLVTPLFEESSIDIEINPSDIRVDVYRSSGCGGQGVNTTDSAVRLTHIPTGIVVYSQTERSQIKNKEKAIKILQTRLYDLKMQEKERELGAERRNKIGSGDRSEKIRTYNYPQNRITDHRINFSIMQLDKVMEGNLDPIIEALITEDQTRKLKGE